VRATGRFKYDIVLMDGFMPNKTGWEVKITNKKQKNQAHVYLVTNCVFWSRTAMHIAFEICMNGDSSMTSCSWTVLCRTRRAGRCGLFVIFLCVCVCVLLYAYLVFIWCLSRRGFHTQQDGLGGVITGWRRPIGCLALS